jgi:hypothetical protein
VLLIKIAISAICLPPVNSRQATSPASVDVQLARETWHARMPSCDVKVRLIVNGIRSATLYSRGTHIEARGSVGGGETRASAA